MPKQTESKATKPDALTEYVVLERTEDGAWKRLEGTFHAKRWQDAIKLATAMPEHGTDVYRGGEFWAVPASSGPEKNSYPIETVEKLVSTIKAREEKAEKKPTRSENGASADARKTGERQPETAGAR